VATSAWDVNRLLVVGALTRYRSEIEWFRSRHFRRTFEFPHGGRRVWKRLKGFDKNQGFSPTGLGQGSLDSQCLLICDEEVLDEFGLLKIH
jgi:hypothetical protein